jgi:hypothetical protein
MISTNPSPSFTTSQTSKYIRFSDELFPVSRVFIHERSARGDYSSRNNIRPDKNSESQLDHRLEGEYNEKLDWRSGMRGKLKERTGSKNAMSRRDDSFD